MRQVALNTNAMSPGYGFDSDAKPAPPQGEKPASPQEGASPGEYPAYLDQLIISRERSGPAAVSPKGAVGINQIMPSTAAAYGVSRDKLLDQKVNMALGNKIRRDLWEKYHDPVAVMVAYNAGPKTADRWLAAGRDPGVLPAETQKYIGLPGDAGLKSWATSESPELKARGDAIMAEADQMRDRHVSAISELMAQANTAPAGSKARDDAIAEIREREHRYSLDYERISMHPPPMKPVDALANFGSAGTIIALIGGLFARRHMTAALGAAGKAMQAINQNNYDEWQREYKVWEQQSRTALDMVKIQHDELRDLIDDKKMSFDEKNRTIQTALSALGMTRLSEEMALGAHEKVYGEVAGLEKAHSAAAQSRLALQLSVAGPLEAKYLSEGMPQAEAHARAFREANITKDQPVAKVVEGKVEDEAKRLNTAWDAAHPGASDAEKAEAHHKNDLAARTEMALATAKSPTGNLSEDSVKLLAKQYEMGDMGVITSLPRGGPGRIQVENQIAADLKDMPDAASQVIMNRLRMAEAKAAATTAGRITMNTEVYSKEAAGAGQQVIETSKKFPRTNYPKINEAIQAYNLHTGDPNIIAFGAAMSAFINAYGKLSNPTGIGVHDADKERITKILDTRLSQGQIEAGVEQVIKEGVVVSTAARQAQEEVLGHIMPHQPGAAAAAPPAAPTATAPPLPNARQAPDGHWYVPAPGGPGKYLRVDP
jgi:hypothetical protein